MGEEVRIPIPDAVAEWEDGLPSANDLTPLSQSLIPSELASAFKIEPEPPRSMVDVNRATETTLSSLRSGCTGPFSFNNDESEEVQGEGSEQKKARRMDDFGEETEMETSEAAKTLKRPRLVWTPQLHKRFVEVVAHLGLKNAVPKTIMQLMNVEGLSRENVASHLQKYRLYVKRMKGMLNEGPLPSDNLFASTPVPPPSCSGGSAGSESRHSEINKPQLRMQIPMPVIPMPTLTHSYTGYDYFQNNGLLNQQRDWSTGNNSKMS